MQKTLLTQAVAVALVALGGGAAVAQSTVTLYGTLDIALDHVKVGSGTSPIVTGAASDNKASQSQTRLTPSISAVNAFGIKGTEDLGNGYKGNFVLEGQMGMDNGSLGNDSRIFGRQAYAGLTTPFGEFRMGRQYAPMFYSFALTTPDAMGATDVYAAGVTFNNLQVRQDNQLSYWLKSGPWLAVAAYSPNAGVGSRVSAARAVANSSAPQAGTVGLAGSSGEILGGATAGGEDSSRRGQSVGLMVGYLDQNMRLTASYHGNKFGVDAGVNSFVPLAGTYAYVPLYRLGDYNGIALTGRFNLGSPATRLSVGFHEGQYDLAATTGAAAALVTVDSAKVRTFTLGIRQDIGDFSIGAEGGVSKFTNFSKGKDSSLVLMGDYNLSKRTALYTRIGYAKDDEGDAVMSSAGVRVHGGPFSGLTSLGSNEIPTFAGAGINAGGTTSYFSVGIRHTF